MTTSLLIILVVIIGGFVALYFALRQMLVPKEDGSKVEDVVNKVFGLSVNKIVAQSKSVLQGERETIKTDLDNKQKMMETLVKQLQDDMKMRQAEIRDLERDRTKKFTEISAQMEEHRKFTEKLEVSTKQLASVLSNNQQRGEWGERIIEDLMQSNGLIEGVHYLRQQKTGTGLRPDITLLLPNKRNVPVDVKFPYSEVQKMANAESSAAKQVHMKQFALDLKEKVKKVSEYIDVGEGTLDYAIMFVPNEMIFSFINQKFPEIVDEALHARVIIVSPFTFLIVARTVMESYRNFMIGDRLKDVIGYIDEFVGEWSKFKDKFAKYGRTITALQTDYEELSGTRVRQLDKKIEKVAQVQRGSLLETGKKKTVDLLAD